MNNLLKIKLKFASEKKTVTKIERNLTSNRYTDTDKIDQLIDNLEGIKSYYKSQKTIFKDAIVDVYYNGFVR